MPLGKRTILAPLTGPLVAWVGRLRFPWLLGLTVLLFAADLVIPDIIPFADEILLGLIAALLAALKKRPDSGKPG